MFKILSLNKNVRLTFLEDDNLKKFKEPIEKFFSYLHIYIKPLPKDELKKLRSNKYKYRKIIDILKEDSTFKDIFK